MRFELALLGLPAEYSQAVRNSYDLNCMSVPSKYREIGDFHEYYSGKRKAPYLTVFVGGNHEASNHLFELYHGGWVAPNIYYLGAASIIRVGPLRIAGLSGIWKGYNYNKPHFERLPYSQDDIKSIYHVRETDVRKLLQVRTQVDIGISHDWPRGIEWKGDWKTLFRQKDLFEKDAREGKLGSTGANYVMERLRPPHWFSAHLHVKFSAIRAYEEDRPVEPPPEIPFEYTMESLKYDRIGPDGKIYTVIPEHVAKAKSVKPRSMDEVDGQGAVPVVVANGSSVNVHNSDEIDINMDDDDCCDNGATNGLSRILTGSKAPTSAVIFPVVDVTVPEDVRAQLPPSFTRAAPPPSASPTKTNTKLPFPEGITNALTRFLALDKCLPERQFLQILELNPVNSAEDTTGPYVFSYDKEWLAITRVFASELRLGDRAVQNPEHKGEAFYRTQIEKEEAWVEENIVKRGLMKIPENFEVTAPVYDPSVGIYTKEQPREYSNPQTTAFCQLLAINNPFHISEDERDRRMASPPVSSGSQIFRGLGRGARGGFGGGGRSGYRGHRGRGGRSNIDIWSGRRKGF